MSSSGPMPQDGSPEAVTTFLAAFVDGLYQLGVCDVVISPGSRSTPLALMFHASPFRSVVDIDERGGAFLALGLAKASRRPVCLVCTSGTAVANYLPAVLEAQTSRVPLIILTGDRPSELRDLGAPQTADQVKVFGGAVNQFREMPLCPAGADGVRFARQISKETFIAATDPVFGPVHLNFPFREPLLIEQPDASLFVSGAREVSVVAPQRFAVDDETMDQVIGIVSSREGVIICGEGRYPLGFVEFARKIDAPILADPLSGLRSLDDPAIIDCYDGIFRSGEVPHLDYVIRFGRLPVSKTLVHWIETEHPLQIVIDPYRTRDFTHGTDLFIPCDASAFIEAGLRGISERGVTRADGYLALWNRRADAERERLTTLSECDEGAFLIELFAKAEPGSLLFVANSLSIRLVDTFLHRGQGPFTVLGNRGLNGIDGTLSSALGAALVFERSYLICGDIAFLHDVNALSLAGRLGHDLTVVLFNNKGGGIFEMLPQRSDQRWFEDLFLTPQQVEFKSIVEGFGVCYTSVGDIDGFRDALDAHEPGVEVIEIREDLDSLPSRLAGCW